MYKSLQIARQSADVGYRVKNCAFKWGVYTPHIQREEVAAMANGYGGVRIGAGQRKKGAVG